MDTNLYFSKFSRQYDESYPGHAERVGATMRATVLSEGALEEKVVALAVLVAVAPSEVDAKSILEPGPTKQVRAFLATLDQEMKNLFREAVLKVNNKLTDKANYYLGEFPQT